MNTESFDIDFCDALDRYLATVLPYDDHKLVCYATTDGVEMPFIQKQLTKKSVNDTRKIETTVWLLIGKDNVQFALVLYFGKYSLRRYAKGQRLNDCLPPPDSNAAYIDFENKLVELHLL